MTKELFVSSTPHETKVGLMEDDLLAEIYLERENEYTLAGSIYKGRVTRVLPGMQSAFVDIGLERDAFLYVSDFMELQDEDEVEEIPTNLAPSQPYQSPSPTEAHVPLAEARIAAPASEAHTAPEEHAEPAAQTGESRERPRAGENREGRGDWRSRRRRGRRGERMPESKFARSTSESPRVDHSERTDHPERADHPERTERPERSARPERTERSEYGPPPGYQPIMLPGESISKYQRLAQTQQRAGSRSTSQNPDAPAPLTAAFPEDEPLFAKPEADRQPAIPEPQDKATHDKAKGAAANAQVGSSEWDREQKRLHEMNVAAVFGGAAAEAEVHGDHDRLVTVPEHSDQSTPPVVAVGTMEEEVIEEDETDLASYVEDLEEDAAFDEEELEEETRSAEDYREPVAQEIAASSEPVHAAGSR
jgi:ribonuclease G